MSSVLLFSAIAAIPFFIGGLIAIVWAVRRLIDLPREGWLIIIGTSILMFGSFGLPNIVTAAMQWGGASGAMMTWPVQISSMLIFFGVRAAGWLVLLAAVFGPLWLSQRQQPEDWGLPLPNDEDAT